MDNIGQDLRKEGFMAMNDHIDLILFQDTEVNLPINRHRGSEEDVLKLGGDHRASPPIRKGTPGG